MGEIQFKQLARIALETLTQCPICTSNSFSPFLQCKDYLVSHQEFTIQACTQCGFRFTNPRPDKEELGNYYKSDQYISHNDNSGDLVSIVYRSVRNYALRSKVNLITNLSGQSGRVLDVGCGTGAFLEKCKQAGWQVNGTEPDTDARAISSQKLRIEVKSDINLLPTSSSFDIITMWHVLEHVADLNETITKLYQLLTTNGTLLIAVPNSDSYDAHYFKQYWAAYDVPRHLYHFTPITIEPLFQNHGFVLQEKRPMVFDAFYIALLSTDYQYNKTNYPRSIQVGLTSNGQAKQTGNWSSVLYIFKKA